MLQPGKMAPDFMLSGDDGGEMYSLRRMLADGPLVLAFFKVSCPVCRFTFPFLERLSAAPGTSRFSIYGISQDSPEATAYFRQEQGIHFTTLLRHLGGALSGEQRLRHPSRADSVRHRA